PLIRRAAALPQLPILACVGSQVLPERGHPVSQGLRAQVAVVQCGVVGVAWEGKAAAAVRNNDLQTAVEDLEANTYLRGLPMAGSVHHRLVDQQVKFPRDGAIQAPALTFELHVHEQPPFLFDMAAQFCKPACQGPFNSEGAEGRATEGLNQAAQRLWGLAEQTL